MRSSNLIFTILRSTLLLLAVIFLPSLAQAHPGVPGHTHGFVNGLVHPLTGFDHLCAMIAVGLWAAQCGGRAFWAVPLTFVSVMAMGGLFGMAGGPLPLVETGIASSVLILGILIAVSARLPLPASVVIVGAFALFHGYVHGAEMPATNSGLAYGLAAILATASLHLCGIGLGLIAARANSMQLIRYVGGAITVCGVYLCFAS
jgi:urease accessory protein